VEKKQNPKKVSRVCDSLLKRADVRKYTGIFSFIQRHLKSGPMAHTCNPRYSGGKDQEEVNPHLAASSQDPILKISNMRKG
jgi:hypothetical protein